MTEVRVVLRRSQNVTGTDSEFCACCGQVRRLTFHHLIPKKIHRRKHFKKRFTRAQLNLGIMICQPCHEGIHRLFDEMTLAKRLNSLPALLEEPALQKHFGYTAKLRLKR